MGAFEYKFFKELSRLNKRVMPQSVRTDDPMGRNPRKVTYPDVLSP